MKAKSYSPTQSVHHSYEPNGTIILTHTKFASLIRATHEQNGTGSLPLAHIHTYTHTHKAAG